MLAKANQALATLDKYRTRLDQVSTRLTALEFEGGATLHDVLTVLQRSELVTRMAVEIERYIVELGTRGPPDRDAARGDDGRHRGREGRARARLPLRLLRRGVRRRARGDRPARPPGPARLRSPGRAARLRPQAEHARLSRLAARLPRAGAHPQAAEARRRPDRRRVRRPGRAAWPRPTPSSRRSRASARSGRRTSARACAGCRRSTSWTATCRLEHGPPDGRPRRRRTPFRHKQPKRQR